MSGRPLPRPGPIYAIADAETLAPAPVAEAVRAMAEAGISWIQLRAKKLSGEDLFALTEAALAAVQGTGASLWLDDRADIAALLPVDGVHVGQRDLPPAAVRGVVGPGVWIGRSTHRDSEVEEAAADPEVDVVAVGPVFPTSSKENPDPVVGLGLVRRARTRTARPLVAIGGIDAGNVLQVLAAGADTAAVLGAVCRGDVYRNCTRLLAAARS